MDKYNNLTSEELVECIKSVVEKHENKKLEITNMSNLIDKKIEELTNIEAEYANMILVLNEKSKNVRQEIRTAI